MEESILGGIGVEINCAEDRTIIVRKVIPNSPAFRKGIQEGDKILEVEGQTLKSLPFTDVIMKIRGPIGSLVRLKILKKDGNQVNVELRREPVTPITIIAPIKDSQ